MLGLYQAIKDNPEVVQATNSEAAMDLRQNIAATFFESPSPDVVQEMMKSPEQIERKLELLQRMRTLNANGGWPAGAEFQHTARVPAASALNEAKPAAPIFGSQGDDIVDAEVVEHDPAERAAMMNEETGRLVRIARSRLAQQPESSWEPEHYDLKNALDAYESDPPTEPAEMDAVHEHLTDLNRRI